MLSQVVAAQAKARRVALPARWSRWQRRKNTLIYRLLRAAALIWRHFPVILMRPAAAVVGLFALCLARRERQIAVLQLRQAFPTWTRGRCRKTVWQMFAHLARAGLELGRLDVFLRGRHAVRLTDAQRRTLDAAFAEGRGVVGVTGHIGNWELLAQILAHEGYPIHTIAKPLYDPRLTRWVHRLRSAHGLGVLWRGDDNVAKDMLRVFRNGGMLALLIDQDTDVDGTFVPFFGRPAHTPTAAAKLALRFDAPVIVAWVQRHPLGHRVHIERLAVADNGAGKPDVDALTAAMTARLQHAIVQSPSQWVWMHRRWRRSASCQAAKKPESKYASA